MYGKEPVVNKIVEPGSPDDGVLVEEPTVGIFSEESGEEPVGMKFTEGLEDLD